MRRNLLTSVLVLASLGLLIGGCTTLVRSPAERAHMIRVVEDYDAKLIVEDMDTFLLQNHPTRLTRWHVR